MYSRGLARVEAIAVQKFARPPADLAGGERLVLAKEVERVEPAFFAMLVAHVMQSFYGSPRHGGNRDAASWRMLGVPAVQIRGRSSA
jgi:gluconate 2-dehydrogenase gamma chain